MATIAIVCVLVLVTAIIIAVGAALLRASCYLANSFNRATTQGAPIPLVSFKDAAGIIFASGFLLSLLDWAMIEILPLFQSVGLSHEFVQAAAKGSSSLFFVLLVAIHLPSEKGTGKSLRVLAAALLLGLILVVNMAIDGIAAVAG